MKWFRWMWRWSPVVTLPVVAVFLVWAFGAGRTWFDFQVRMHTSSDLNLHKVGQLEANHLLATVDASVTRKRREQLMEQSGLRSIHLYVDEARLRKLNSNLPHSGRDYVKGGMLNAGRVQEVDLRYRGDNVYHWGYWKKSWRVKTKRGELFEGMRKFNLVAPRTTEIVNNYLALLLAEKMGLITPKVELVNVVMNGEVQGIFILTEQLDESTIRRFDLMPGDVYSGELVGLDSYRGVENNLFEASAFWTKVAINNHFDEDAMDPLEAFLREINRVAASGDASGLEETVDLEAFATFNVWETVVGTVHVDDLHNWRLYYDPWETQMVPIAWDPVGWHRSTRQRPGVPFRPDVISSRAHVALHHSGPFLRAKAQRFQEFFEQGLDRHLLSELDRSIQGLEPLLPLDPNLVEEGVHLSAEEVLQELQGLRTYLVGHLENLRRAHCGDRARFAWDRDADGALLLDFREVRLVDHLGIKLANVPAGDPEVVLEWRQGDEVLSRPLSVRQNGSELELNLGLVTDMRMFEEAGQPILGWAGGLHVLPTQVRLRIGGLGADDPVLSLAARLDGQRAFGQRAELQSELGSLPPMVGRIAQQIGRAPLVWSGELLMEGITFIDQPLVIEPGTKIRMAPGASVICRNSVLALGTQENPIEFVPAGALGPETAWGTFALKGNGADGSQMQHCRFLGGSGWKPPLSEYSSMFSVHGPRGVTIEDCIFEDSYIVDDMVHGVYCEVVFRRCTWLRSLSDALDVDISEARIEDCHFVDSGNDAIDLMTTSAVVRDSLIEGSGDKAISIGEASRLVALGNRMERCEIGLQSKDGSVAFAVNCEIRDCPIGVDAYKKNWRYNNGGNIAVYNSILKDCGVSLQADRNSMVSVVDSYIHPPMPSMDAHPNLRLVGVDAEQRTSSNMSTLHDLGDPRLKELLNTLGRWDISDADFGIRGTGQPGQ